MSRTVQLRKLEAISQLILDAGLSSLKAAAQARQQSEQHLADLLVPQLDDGSLSEIAAQLASLRYQGWADVRRGEINLVLAQQTAVWMDARDAARLAFGRNATLAGLRKRQK